MRPPQAAALRFAEGEEGAIQSDIGGTKTQFFLPAPAARRTTLQTSTSQKDAPFDCLSTLLYLYCRSALKDTPIFLRDYYLGEGVLQPNPLVPLYRAWQYA